MLRLDGRLALVRGLLRPSSELSGAGSRGADQLEGRKVERDAAEPGQRGRGWDRERRSRSESPSDGKAGRRGATAFERRAGEQNAAPPCASFCSNFTGTSMSYAVRRNHFVLGVFTISSVIAPSPNSWGQFCCVLTGLCLAPPSLLPNLDGSGPCRRPHLRSRRQGDGALMYTDVH